MDDERGKTGGQEPGRETQYNWRLSKAERAELDARAEQAGLAPATYLRTVALGKPGPRARRRPALDRAELIRLGAEVSRVGNNLNQEVRLGHLGEPVPLYEAKETLRRLNKVLDQIERSLGMQP